MVETFDCDKYKEESKWLVQGSTGDEVKLLQTHLKTLGSYTKYKGLSP